MALWPSIMACSQCGDITVSLNRGCRPLVWMARVIGEREPDSTQIASMRDGGRAKINQSDGSGPGRTTKTEMVCVLCVCVWGGQFAVREGEWRSKGQSEGRYLLKGLRVCRVWAR